MSEIRTYIGTVDLKRPKWGGRIPLANKMDLSRHMEDQQLAWIRKSVPDWLFWKDEFRPEAHLYSKTVVSKNTLLMAHLFFKQTTPSHYPLNDLAEWWNHAE